MASSILKRLGIDENVDYNKPLIDTSDPYYQHYRYTSSERSASECSVEIQVDSSRKMENPTPDKVYSDENFSRLEHAIDIKQEIEIGQETESKIAGQSSSRRTGNGSTDIEMATAEQRLNATVGVKGDNADQRSFPQIKVEIKSEIEDEDGDCKCVKVLSSVNETVPTTNSNDFCNNNNNKHNKNKITSDNPTEARSPADRMGGNVGSQNSPTDSHRSLTPKSPASSIKSYDGGDRSSKYPSDSLNALSSMFDSLGSGVSCSTNNSGLGARCHGGSSGGSSASGLINKLDTQDNPGGGTSTNSLAALRQFCIKKEKTV